MNTDVIIIGAGLSGLACALELSKRNIGWTLLEASDRVGGRVATDEVNGFLLDRGFQVLQDAYPEARHVLDYDALKLHAFHAGAAVWLGNGKFATVSNPLKHPQEALSTLFAPIGTLGDKFKILGLRSSVIAGSLDELMRRPEITTPEALKQRGFSEKIIERFFQPFLRGIFFDRELQTSSKMFEFVFRMFSIGSATLPERGMAAIPLQMVSRLDQTRIRLNAAVSAVQTDGTAAAVSLRDGTTLQARAVVVATDGQTASHLTNGAIASPKDCSTACLYFSTETLTSTAESHLRRPLLLLNGTGTGLVNNICSPSSVCDSYAPTGFGLISVSTVGLPSMNDAELEQAVRNELAGWFGGGVQSWKHLKTYRIKHALPDQTAPALRESRRPVQLAPTLFVCGDHRDTASIHGAMVSGRRAAEAVAQVISVS